MKQAFLDQLAVYLLRHFGDELGQCCILLPNRRAGLFLGKHLGRRLDRASWMPVIRTISEFVEELTPLQREEPLDLVLRLHGIYAAGRGEAEDLDEFYPWGQMMLRDFDEMDKYLVDPASLFRNLSDLKALEDALAGLDEEQIRFIRQFWEGFTQGEDSREKQQFAEIWERLPLLYKGLTGELKGLGLAYQGMQYRDIAERIRDGEMDPLPWKHVVVVGFNALNTCEKRLFSWLRDTGARFFWDHDPAYMRNPADEAGRFMRENILHFPSAALEPESPEANVEAEIRIFELSSDVMQARTLQRILEEGGPVLEDFTDTAVVLCDESLLLPVLLSVPDAWEEINITMGYPMDLSPLSSLVDGLMGLQRNCREGKEAPSFYYRDVRSVLLHPYLSDLANEKGHTVLESMIKENMIRVDARLFASDRERVIFRKVQGAEDWLRYMGEVLTSVMEGMPEQEGLRMPELHQEFLDGAVKQLNKLEGALKIWPELSQTLLERLFRKMLWENRIPFEGEPLAGLQVMGILETRLLDFRHIIFLSMNEEQMPASSLRQSYIPYSLRLAFGMPAREDMDAIYAYYFKRLLQRAEKVDLLFNATSEGIRTGEMSRYLHQIRFEKDHRFIRPVMEVTARAIPPIGMLSSSLVQKRLERYTAGGEGEAYMSPSALNTYLDCPLKFYFRYLARLGEADEVAEEIDPAGFGTVVHDSLKILYESIARPEDGSITADALISLRKKGLMEKVVREEFRKVHFGNRPGAVLEGRNLLIIQVMLRYLDKIIDIDLRAAPFQLLSVEQTFRRELEVRSGDRMLKLKLGGKIDRIDRVNGLVRVIDYKTGKPTQSFPSVESLFDASRSNRNGAALQALFYSWLVAPLYGGASLMPGLYAMKGLFKESFDPGLSMGEGRVKQVLYAFDEVEAAFVNEMEALLSRLFNPEQTFTQTEDRKKCEYCDFATLCSR